MEAEEAEDAEVVLADAGFGIADEADAAGFKVGQTVQRVDHPARPVGVKRVHREIAALGVFLDPAGKGHHGTAAIGFHIAAEGGDLVRLALRDDRHRAMLDPGGNDFETRSFGQIRDCFGRRIGGNVDISDRLSQQVVAHAAADEERPEPRRFQRGKKRLGAGMADPVAGQFHDTGAFAARP